MSEQLALMVAYAQDRIIGNGNDIPWHYPEDFKHFKTTTMGHALIMGRLTCESIGRPLPGRRNILVTRQADYQALGYEVFTDLDAALAAARETDDMPFICGGGNIYKQMLPQVTRMFISEIDIAVEGDTVFPEWETDTSWQEISSRRSDCITYRELERRL